MAHSNFIVEILEDGIEQQVTCTLGGKLRKHRIRVILHDEVDIAVSPYDMSRGRIVFRHKG